MNKVRNLGKRLIGDIPVDWKCSRFKKLYSKPIRDFGSFSSTKLITFLSAGVPFIKSEMILRGKIDWTNSFFIAEEVHMQLNKSHVYSGNILFSKIGSALGKAVVYDGSKGVCNSNAAVGKIELNPCENDPHFFTHLLNSRLAEKQFRRLIVSLLPRLNLGDISSLYVPVPPLPEQKKIATILSTWDRAVELTERLIAFKQKRKNALMQLLLAGQIRISEFTRKATKSPVGIARVPSAVRRGLYPPSVQPGLPKIGKPPVGWTRTTMGRVLHIQKRQVQLNNDVVYQLVVARRNRGGIEPREQLLGKDIKTPTQFEVHAGDFVISRRQIIHGACGVVPSSLHGAIVSNEYAVCTVSDQMDLTFLKYLSHTLYFQQTCFHSSVGVALEKMLFRLEKWLKVPFLLPSIEEQRAIASVLTTMDKEIELLIQKKELLSIQKKGLMQQLLTGKVRVPLNSELVKV